MSPRAATCWLLAAALALVAAAAPTQAQEKKKSVRVSKTGQVVAVSPGIITAKADGAFYNLKVNKDKNIIAVTGNLDRSQLKRGMLVRCTGTLKGNTVEGEVAEIKVFGKADGYQFGILQDSPDQPATVTGQLSKISKDAATIAAGRKNITLRLAEDMQVVVDTKDYSILQGGEEIAFDGQVAADGKTVGCRKIVVTIGKTDDDKSAEEPPAKKKKKAN
jgi:hypothetical protein